MPEKLRRLAELEAAMGGGSLWADPEKARAAVEEMKGLKRVVDPFQALETRVRDALELQALAWNNPVIRARLARVNAEWRRC